MTISSSSTSVAPLFRMARTTTLLLLMLSFSSPSFLISFFGAHAVPIDLTTTNSSSPEFLGSRMFTPENAKQANFIFNPSSSIHRGSS
ncbi:hypothetical protein F5879DRAFT_975019 [Lentinula edodes]|nr:hypothetical protein F5879DRAFT_975019 [Lentinula edodes]